MIVEIYWTNKAEQSLENIVEYIKIEWSEKSAIKFIKKVDDIINSIKQNPFAFQMSDSENIRRAVITKQTSLYYEIFEDKIYLLTFWDNRKNPKKIKSDIY